MGHLNRQNNGLTINLVRDSNNNGIIEGNESYASNFGGDGVNAGQDLLPGTYYVEVFNSNSTPYTLTIAPGNLIPLLPSDPGDTLATALDLGDLVNTISRSDMIMRDVDSVDTYRFTVIVPGQVQIRVTGQNDPLRLRLARVIGGESDDLENLFGGDPLDLVISLEVGVYLLVLDGALSTPYQLTIESID